MAAGTIEVRPQHLDALRRLGDPNALESESIVPSAWVQGIPRVTASPIHDRPATRRSILEMAASKDVSTFDLIICIFAWGGMRRDHARVLYEADDWLHVASQIRTGAYSRSEAYAALRTLKTRGMGPAFFTKLIYFLAPRTGKPIGYIMDQWLSCSINLLFGETVLMDVSATWSAMGDSMRRITNHVVSRLNTEVNYERFCQCIDELTDELTETPDRVEVMLFSEGRRKGLWRNYVHDNRSFSV